jgi:hypothetical protein
MHSSSLSKPHWEFGLITLVSYLSVPTQSFRAFHLLANVFDALSTISKKILESHQVLFLQPLVVILIIINYHSMFQVPEPVISSFTEEWTEFFIPQIFPSGMRLIGTALFSGHVFTRSAWRYKT